MEEIQTLPGCIINILFDYAEQNDFKENTEYNTDEIFDKCGGVLINIISRSENMIKVLYMPYGHHNEPRLTTTLILEDNHWIISDITKDWSRTKYSNRDMT